MGIRVQHQGAGAGAGIDDGFKRKYDMRMQQLDKQQDRMFRIGLQNRDVALQRENMLIGNNLRAGERQAVRDAKQADWLQDQKAAADERNLAAANARATLKGTIKAAIDAGEFEKADIDLINKAFADADVILSDKWKGDDAQKFDALAENQGRLMALAQRRRVREAPKPVPFDQADPKIQQSIIDRVFDQVAESGETYSKEDIANEVRGLYDSIYGGGQAPSPGASTPAVPARGGAAPFGLPPLPDAPIEAPMTAEPSGASQSATGFKFGGRKKPQPAPVAAPEPKPILSWDKAIELAMQELTQGDNPSPITKDSLHAAAQGFYDKFNGPGQQPAVTQPVSPPAGTQPAPRIDATIPPPPVPGQPRSAEPMGQPSSSVQATEVPGQFAYGSPDRQIGGRPVSDFTSVWGQFVDEMSRPAASHTRQDKTPPPEPERKQLPPQNQPPIKWDPRYDALPDAPPIEWGDGKFVNQHSRQKKSSMSPRMQEIKKHYDTLPPDAQNTFRHAMGRDERMRNVAIERLRQEGKDGGLFGDGPANPEHQSKLYGVGGNAGTVQDFFNKTSSAQPTAPQDAPQVFNPRENLNRLNAQKMRANQNPVASPPEGGATTNAPAPQDTTQAPLPRAAPSLDWGQAYERYKADPVALKRAQNAEAAYNNAVDDTAKNAIGLLLTEQPHEVKARAAKILKDKYGIVLSEIMGRQ